MRLAGPDPFKSIRAVHRVLQRRPFASDIARNAKFEASRGGVASKPADRIPAEHGDELVEIVHHPLCDIMAILSRILAS